MASHQGWNKERTGFTNHWRHTGTDFHHNSSQLHEVINICKQVLHGDVASLVLDVINVIDHETLVNENNDDRQKLCGMLKELENWLSDSMIKERLEIDTLQDCNLLKTKKIFYSRFIKVKTKLFYKQQKFNLLREENEGYAKLF